MTDLSLVLASDVTEIDIIRSTGGSVTVAFVVDPQPERADGLGDTLHRWRWFGPCHYDTDQQLAAAIEQHARETYEGKDIEVEHPAPRFDESPVTAVVHVVRVVGLEREAPMHHYDQNAPPGRWIFTAEVRKA